jgi:N-acetylmuramoyl-L-alanine amidase
MLKRKIYLSPSCQIKNEYAVGNTNEAAQCRAIALLCVPALERCGFEAKTNTTGDMYERVRESNAWGADAHIPIHTNAFNGEVAGFRGFYYKDGCKGMLLAGRIMDAIAPITPGTSDGLQARPELYEVRETYAACAYLELGFHDNAEEARYIIDHKPELAEKICEGVCKHFGVTYVPPKQPEPEKKPDGGKLYRVQVGAFRMKKNAENMRDELREIGYEDAFIVAD